MILQPIVEGKGEVVATRQLLSRLMGAAEQFHFEIAHPIRRNSSQLLNPVELARAVQLALNTENVNAILVLFDGDISILREDGTTAAFCPKIEAPLLAQVARSAAGHVPCELVVAHREYESWLVAGIEGLRGVCGISADALCPSNHEITRDAKSLLSNVMPANKPYSPMRHQVSMTAKFDIRLAHQRSRSFRKLCKAFGELHANAGTALAPWPPAEW